MFSSLRIRILLGVYIFIILSIPVGAYLATQQQTYKSSAKEDQPKKPITKTPPSPTTSPIQDLLSTSLANLEPTPSSPTIATSFGPTLSLKATLEGRPQGNQATKLFVGIVEGTLSTNPKFLLSFTVDLPADGSYSNLSLAGLSAGTKYTALLKGTVQIATSSSFIMSPTVSNLNEGQSINMLTGDLNEDNVINLADLSIAKSGNKLADFNQDGILNAFDFAIITKNLGQIGASGAWTSPLPKVATPSAGLALPVGSATDGSTFGYWLWIPK